MIQMYEEAMKIQDVIKFTQNNKGRNQAEDRQRQDTSIQRHMTMKMNQHKT